MRKTDADPRDHDSLGNAPRRDRRFYHHRRGWWLLSRSLRILPLPLGGIVCFAFIALGTQVQQQLGDRLAVSAQEGVEESPEFFYYNWDKKVPLTLSTNKLGVVFEPDLTQSAREALVESDPDLEALDGPELPTRLQMIRLKPNLTKEEVFTAKDRLWARPGIKYVSPVFLGRKDELVPGDGFRVRFRNKTGEDEIDAMNQLHGVEVMRKNVSRFRTVYDLRVLDPKTSSGLEVANRYQEDSKVFFAVPSWLTLNVRALATPNDTYFSYQWQLHNGANPDINAPAAWDTETGSSSIIIAITDTGLDGTSLTEPVCIPHEDITVWTNSAEANGDPDEDDDGNGYVDDFHGWRFNGLEHHYDNDPSDDHLTGHGTCVSGIAGAKTNNSQGVAGVVWGATIMPVKNLSALLGSGTTADAVKAIEYAADNGAHVINCSWGGTEDDADLENIITTATTTGRGGKGCVVVCGVGNDGDTEDILYPARYATTIAVGATDDEDVRFDFNNGGPELDVMAPTGNFISGFHHTPTPGPTRTPGPTATPTPYIPLYTTDRAGEELGRNARLLNAPPGAYSYTAVFMGNSGTAAFVSGLAGLLIAYDSNLTADQIQVIIQASAKDLGDAGRDNLYGFGRIDADAALDFAAAPPHVMTLKDANGAEAMHIDAIGNLDVDGNLVQNATSQQLTESSSDLWLFKDGANVVARVDSGRNLYLKGTLSQRQHTLTPTSASYIWKYESGDVGDVVGYIDEDGNLKLRGTAY